MEELRKNIQLDFIKNQLEIEQSKLKVFNDRDYRYSLSEWDRFILIPRKLLIQSIKAIKFLIEEIECPTIQL